MMPRSQQLSQPTSTCLKGAITTRRFALMGMSSAIGAGLLLSTGQALAVGGAASLVIALAVVGLAAWMTMCALGELSTNFPVKGSFYEYPVRFISPLWGFAMGWNYVIEFIIVVPFEIMVIVICARFWNPDLSALYIVPLLICGLIIIYSFGVRRFAEAENIFGILKIMVITIFSLTAICIVARAVPTDRRPASQLAYNDWRTEAFKNGPSEFFFLFSPFVVAISQANIPLLPDIINAILIVAFFSMANASVFASSRALQAISARGMGPRFCATLHRGRPLGALAVVFLFSLLSLTEVSPYGDTIFVWLLSLASCANYLAWSSICLREEPTPDCAARRRGILAQLYDLEA